MTFDEGRIRDHLSIYPASAGVSGSAQMLTVLLPRGEIMLQKELNRLNLAFRQCLKYSTDEGVSL